MIDKHLTILAIDDSEEDLLLIQTFLKKDPHYHFTFLKASNGKEGLDLFAAHAKEIDCILLDQKLPDIDGLDLLPLLKAKNSQSSIIMLTGIGTYEDDLMALEKGAADYINKDQVTPLSLGRAIRYAIEKQRIINDLELANRAKEHFIKIMSHDMKTPLTSLIGFAALMAKGKYGPVTINQSEQLNKIVKSAEYLNKIINDMMTSSLLTKGKIELDSETFDLVDSINFCLSILKPKALAKNISLTFETDFPKLLFHGDKQKLTEAIQNLLENAMKFTNQGSVSIALKKDDHQVELHIKDTGIGMSEEQISTLFIPFAQADDSIYKKYGGLGLGLSIAKSFIELHGGFIDVKSQLNEGTEFTIKLPLNHS